MFLGIEIGGTKLQLGVGRGDRPELVELVRMEVQPEKGAAGILGQIQRAAPRLVAEHRVARVGIGFGGPVDAAAGRVITSHQVPGWNELPLAAWCQERLGVPAILENDCNAAALAEARLGAGQGRRTVLFLTVGTGIGGGLVIDGQLHGRGQPAAAEIGHLRPGTYAERATETVECWASGPGIARRAQQQIAAAGAEQQPAAGELLRFADGDPSWLTAELVAQAAGAGNPLARRVLEDACRVLGWAIAQAITLLAPEVVVVGGGVSLIGEAGFFQPLRESVQRYVFPPLSGSYCVVPARLGEQVVVHGALAACKPSPH